MSAQIATSFATLRSMQGACKCCAVLVRLFAFFGRGLYKLEELQLQRDFEEVFDVAKIIRGTRFICTWELITLVLKKVTRT